MVLVVRPVFQTPAEGVGFGARFTPARGTDVYKCKTETHRPNGSGSTSKVFKYDPTFTLPFPTRAHAQKNNDLRSYRRPLGKREQVAADRKSSFKLSENAKDNIEKPKRKSKRDERTSESHVDPRAASECSIDIQRSQSEDSEARVALFSPEFFRNCAKNLYLDDDAIYELNVVAEEVSALEIQDDPVNLKPESTLTTCPRILRANMIHQLEEPKRKSTRDERTSESHVDPRAASECSIDIQRSQSEDGEASVDETSGDKLRKAVGDMSLTLFSPEFFRNCAKNLYLDDDDAIYELNVVTEEVSGLEIQDDPVNLKFESTLTTCPKILRANMIHQLEEPKRKSTRDERLSESQVDPKVAYKCSFDIQSSQSEDSEASVDETSGDKLGKAVGDMSLTLFSPEYFRNCAKNLCLDDDAIYELNVVTEAVSALETHDDPVNLKPEPMSTLTACPRILTANMIHQLIEEALPMSLRTARWDRIYALGRDGDEFTTMTRNCANFKDTIILAVTSQGHILGGYASAHWVKQEGHGMSRSFYGNGESFLFASHPEEEDQQNHSEPYRKDVLYSQNLETQATLQPKTKEEKKLHIFKWTGSNTYSQYVDDGQVAMGGGGAFGLIIQNNFSRGSTGRCSTFGNPPLVPRGLFEIVNFEVYGFTSLGETLKSKQE